MFELVTYAWLPAPKTIDEVPETARAQSVVRVGIETTSVMEPGFPRSASTARMRRRRAPARRVVAWRDSSEPSAPDGGPASDRLHLKGRVFQRDPGRRVDGGFGPAR